MPVDIERRRLLLAAKPSETRELRYMFTQAPLNGWEVLEADTFERARFLLMHNPCDVLLIDEGLYQTAGTDGLCWLSRHRDLTAVMLTGMEPDTVARAYEQGVGICLPRRVTLEHPQVLAAALQRAATMGEVHHALRRSADRVLKCRRQIDRLVNLLWRNVPMDPDRQWFSHRHVLERLQEEVARCGRHGATFTLALGEVAHASAGHDEAEELAEWTAVAVSRAKRRCDVAGHYGLRGFMLLMVQTPQPGGVVCCKRLQSHLQEESQKPEGPRGPVRASFGLASFTPDSATSEILLSRAERHLEAAKAGAEGGVVAE